MEIDINNMDDASLEKIFLECSDRTIAYLMVSVKKDDLSRLLILISKERKLAIQFELEVLETTSYFNREEEIEKFKVTAKELERQGQIIIGKHTANCI